MERGSGTLVKCRALWPTFPLGWQGPVEGLRSWGRGTTAPVTESKARLHATSHSSNASFLLCCFPGLQRGEKKAQTCIKRTLSPRSTRRTLLLYTGKRDTFKVFHFFIFFRKRSKKPNNNTDTVDASSLVGLAFRIASPVGVLAGSYQRTLFMGGRNKTLLWPLGSH